MARRSRTGRVFRQGRWQGPRGPDTGATRPRVVLTSTLTPTTRWVARRFGFSGIMRLSRAAKWLQEAEDRRRWHPGRNNPKRTDGSPYASLEVRQRLPVGARWNGIYFRSPLRVVICVRRKRRKEVLFAKKIAGKRGGTGAGRRNKFSDVRCT